MIPAHNLTRSPYHLRCPRHERGWVSTARILDAREAATLRWASRYAIEYFDPTHEPGNPTVLVVRTILRNSVFNNHAAHMRDQKNRLCMNPDGTAIVHPEDALGDGGLGALRGEDPAAEGRGEDEDEDHDAPSLTPSQRLALLAPNNPLNALLMKPTYTPEEIREQLKGTGMDEALSMYNLETILANNKERGGTITSPALLRGLTEISAGGANAYGGAVAWKESEEKERFCVSRQPFDRSFNPHRSLTAETHPLSAVAFDKGLASHIHYTDEMQRIVSAVARSERLGEVAAALLGVPKSVGVRLYASSLYNKRSGDWYTPWHWDNIASPFDKPLVTCWIALNAADPTMGSLAFASGSHKRAEQDNVRQQWTHPDVERAYPGALEPLGTRMWPGDATWHHGGTLHAAWRNEGTRTREGIAITYVAANARLRSGAQLSESIRADDIATWAEWLPRSEFYEHGGRQLRGCVAFYLLLFFHVSCDSILAARRTRGWVATRLSHQLTNAPPPSRSSSFFLLFSFLRRGHNVMQMGCGRTLLACRLGQRWWRIFAETRGREAAAATQNAREEEAANGAEKGGTTQSEN